MKKFILLAPIFTFVFFPLYAQQEAAGLPSILLYNPTNSNVESLVEVPTGSLATPGVVDWGNVHLQADEKIIPFSIHEGKAHRKAALKTPVHKPAPEDLLAFSAHVGPRKWIEIRIVKGKMRTKSAMKRGQGLISTGYPGMTVVISEKTGMISSIRVRDDTLLNIPMQVLFFETADSLVNIHGNMNPGNRKAWLTLKAHQTVSASNVKLISASSNEAMTELNFILGYKGALEVGLTYRIYFNRRLEILLDERPWTGNSPWMHMGLTAHFILAGEKKRAGRIPDSFSLLWI